ncbi:MAG: DNA alkylation repair protein [Firmicutes bacterium]|nr:DNA alkylation repair protein [Bacillota bacterium]
MNEKGKSTYQKELFALQDTEYRDFQVKLIPNIDPETMIGVRTPELRALAKRLAGETDISGFIDDLPHEYFDENQLHAFILSEEKSFESCVAQIEKFLPFVDNWATCDQLSPKVFKKHRKELLPYIRKWIRSKDTYTIRFGTGMLMSHFLDEDFDPEYPAMVAGIRSEEYYVNMMTAWYFATALAKQYDEIIPYIEKGRLDVWTHNKAIQKAIESRRITPEQKEYLRSLKIKPAVR